LLGGDVFEGTPKLKPEPEFREVAAETGLLNRKPPGKPEVDVVVVAAELFPFPLVANVEEGTEKPARKPGVVVVDVLTALPVVCG